MLSGRPIVNSVDEPGSLVERLGCGIQVEAEQEDQVCNAICKLADMTAEARAEMGAKGRKYALDNLEYHTLSQRFLDYVMQNNR